jgi:hypothetical protein
MAEIVVGGDSGLDRSDDSGSNTGTGGKFGPPSERLGFEVNPDRKEWSFVPEFYPGNFTQTKKKELHRYGGSCGTESVSIKTVKNREYHVSGVILREEVPTVQQLLDIEAPVDILSPITPNGGMECFIKSGEIGNKQGWDPHSQQWMFKYTLDLVSTGRDESESTENAIVTAITDDSQWNREGYGF